jgi:hypothetical protein
MAKLIISILSRVHQRLRTLNVCRGVTQSNQTAHFPDKITVSHTSVPPSAIITGFMSMAGES